MRFENRAPEETVNYADEHPLSEERISRLQALARENGWPSDGPRTPLPPSLIEKTGAAE